MHSALLLTFKGMAREREREIERDRDGSEPHRWGWELLGESVGLEEP